MAENSTGQHLLKEKDFVDVVDGEGNDAGFQVPKHWGKDELPAGFSKKKGSGSSSGSSNPPPAREPGVEPKGNASTEEWTAYAKEKGATEEDLKDEDGNALGQKALREKYGTPSE